MNQFEIHENLKVKKASSLARILLAFNSSLQVIINIQGGRLMDLTVEPIPSVFVFVFFNQPVG